jgi:hypothetical protein
MAHASVPFDWDRVETPDPTPQHPAASFVVPVVQRLVEARRPRLEIVALSLAAGIQVHPTINSMTDAALALNVTRAAISKRVRYWRDTLGLRSAHMRSEETREACRQAQLRNHWRRRKSAAETF